MVRRVGDILFPEIFFPVAGDSRAGQSRVGIGNDDNAVVVAGYPAVFYAGGAFFTDKCRSVTVVGEGHVQRGQVAVNQVEGGVCPAYGAVLEESLSAVDQYTRPFTTFSGFRGDEFCREQLFLPVGR